MSKVTEKYDPLFHPKTLAMYGATTDVRKWGFALFHNLLKGGYEGKLYPVHPSKDEVFGVKAYRKIADVPDKIDLAIVTIPPDAVPDVIRECAAVGVKAIVINTAGFAEVGGQGRAMEDDIAATAKAAGIALIGPNSQGIMSAPAKLFPQMMGVQPLGGRISMVSQSGNIGGTLMSWGRKWGTPFGKFVSAGNEAVTTCGDMIRYFGDDVETGVVCAYIEGVRDGANFFDAVKSASKNKPVLVLKGGRTDAGIGAAKSHTGALAGSSAIFDAAVAQAGGIIVGTLEELFDLASAFVGLPLPKGNRIGILTQGGGWGVLAADTATSLGLDVTKLPDRAIEAMSAVLPDRWSRGNPVDMAAGGGKGVVEKCLDTLLECDNVDAVAMLGMGTSAILKWNMMNSPAYPPDRVAELCSRADAIELALTRHVIDAMKRTGKPVVCSSDVVGNPLENESPAVKLLAENSLVMYNSPERCARVLAGLWAYAKERKLSN